MKTKDQNVETLILEKMKMMTRFGGFAQVIMLCGSLNYISLFYRSRKNTGFTGTSKNHSFRKRSSRLERGKQMPLYFVLTCYLKLSEKRLIVLKETAREIRRQLLEILRFILFIPTGFLAATIVKFLLFFLARIQESTIGLKDGNCIYEKPWVVSPKN